MQKSSTVFSPLKLAVGLALGLAASSVSAATIIWNGASGTDTNWFTAGNWIGGVPGGGDDVKFFDAGTNLTLGLPNNLVNSGFAGYIGSLQLGNTNGMHTIVIAPGQTLSITNTGGLAMGTPADPAVAKNFTNTITGVGGTLFITNLAANLSINQAGANGANRANLNLSGLDNFVVSANRIGIGDGQFPGVAVNNRAGGQLILAKTNNITLAYTDTLANYQTAGKNSAMTMSRNSGNNPGITSVLQLGMVNTFNVDSLNVGMDKSGNNSTAAHGIIQFNPVFSGLSPVANFYGAGGSGTRVTWWSIGDGNQSASSSNGGGGTNDFSLGTVNAWVNVMSLARDALSSADVWAGPHKGVLIYTNGTVDINTLLIGNQSLETGTSTASSLGIVTLNGAGAVLKVNTNLTLGVATLATAAGTKTYGVLNVTNGTVYANNIAVGVNSISNTINLVNATLIVTNTMATNAAGLFVLNLNNSTLGLAVPTNGSARGLAQTFNTVGTANVIKLDAAPVIFSTYPQSVPLIKYTTWTGSNTFTLASIPAWAPGATLVSNAVNKTLDLSLPTDPRPVISSNPGGYSGNPGDNVNFAVAISAGSVTPLNYRWYLGATPLVDGLTVNGSTISGATAGTLSITGAQPGDNGNYTVIITNIYGAATSSVAVLTISAGAIAPSITGLNNQMVVEGNNATFTASVAGNPAPVIQWQRNGTDIVGANASALIVTNGQYLADDGAVFSIIATNSAGKVTNSATLTVIVPPVITAQPVSIVVTNTFPASFTVLATGVPTPAYQWKKNGNPISGQTSATLNFASVSPSDISTNYSVTITNLAGVTNSVNVALIVNSTMSATAFSPANGAGGIGYDTPLYLTFDQTPAVRAAGKIRIFNVTNSVTPVDTLDLGPGTLQPRTIAGDVFATYPVIITGNTAAIYPHLGVLTSNQTYYVTVDNGVFVDSAGAYFAGITDTNVWNFTTKTGGPANPASLVVAKDNSGDFVTVQGALDSLAVNNASPIWINVRNGVYTEIVDFKKNNVIVRGQSRAGTLIGYANNNNNNASTHSRMSMKVNANDITFDNLTITNMTPQGGSQAEALMIETGAARIIVNNCNVDSFQDTILANTATSKAYFNRTLIQGDVDFIWGGGNLFFTNCEVRYLFRAGNAGAVGPNPSPQSAEVSSNQFSFINCAFTTPAGATNDTIGRTRSITGANMALISCFMSTNLGGWSSDALPTSSYRNWYYGCTNDLGGAVTLSNGIALSSGDANLTLAISATSWLYGWGPVLAPNIISQPGNQSVSQGQTASFTVSATGIPDPTYQWFKDGSSVGNATNATYIIPSAMRANAGNFTVVASNGSGSVTSSVARLTYTGNVAPVANSATYTRAARFAFKILIPGDLSTNWSDADGDSLALTGSVGSTNGASVSYDGNYVYYSSPNDVADQVNYTLGDGQGGTVAGIINIVVALGATNQTQNITGITPNGNGSVTINFAGIPNYVYRVQAATNLALPVWIDVGTNTSGSNGLWQFTDADAASYPTRYYRTVHP